MIKRYAGKYKKSLLKKTINHFNIFIIFSTIICINDIKKYKNIKTLGGNFKQKYKTFKYKVFK